MADGNTGTLPDAEARRASEALERTLTWIDRLDARVPVILGLASAMIGGLASSAPKGWSRLDAGSYVLASFAAACPLAAIIIVIVAIYPRTNGPRGERISSLAYFFHIADLDPPQFVEHFRHQTHEEYVRSLLLQVHRLSEAAQKRVVALRWAYAVLGFGVLLWIPANLLLRWNISE